MNSNINMYWPIALIVLSNIFYNISSKSTPAKVNPFVSLTVTYLFAAVVSCVLYFAMNREMNFLQECKQLNWSCLLLGLSIVGIEAGSIYMYKAGWNISSGQLVYSSLLAIALIVVGYFAYHENITVTKLVGIGVCMVGLFLINK